MKKVLFIIITIICLLLTIWGKFLSTGWCTMILIFLPIIPAQLILFTIAGIFFAIMNNKSTSKYIIYVFLCITSLLYAYTFVDYGDIGGAYTALNHNLTNANLLSIISTISYISNIILSIILIIKSISKSKKKIQ